ncbi:MAG: hypothetical protein N2484_03425 [Clostridia bacterium]|nr:hypothetical protein [Clostridia bacterium]
MLYIYIGCLAFGAVYALASFVLGAHGFDHGSFDHGGVDGHTGGDGADVPSPFNPLVIASAIATFGAVGTITKLGFKMGDLLSSIYALAFSGAVGAAIFFGVVKLMYGSQSNSTFSVTDLIGAEAEVITPIPQNGYGEIALIYNGIRYNFSARAYQEKPIGRRETVRIKDVLGNTVIVTRKISIEDIDLIEKENRSMEKEKENN